MTDPPTTERLRAVGLAAGLVAVGVTDVSPFLDTRAVLEARRAEGLAGTMQFTYRNPRRATEPAALLEGAASLVVGAWPYPAAELPTEEPSPATHPPRPQGRVARYADIDHYAELHAALSAIAEDLHRAGHRTRIVADDNALVDRAAAHRAGLGWFGRNANILVPGHGSWVLLGAVVTDAVLEPSTPVADGCGTCRRCIDACPTGAIVAPGVVDARRCLAWIVQAPGPIPLAHREAMGDRIYGCDDCQEVCPPARRAPAATRPVSGSARVDLLELLASSDAELLARHGRWYIAERDPRHLRRNALVALGNTADPADDEVGAVLRRVAVSADELLAEHARWALDRLEARAGAPA
ncbi:MAG: tRNA epoxyqueuosine(34) reductase QueG [Acidobacteria bacterium]|nr:tRNA epoxyqueuosine(34) reductase QueG [Acidobacteriota bacterium]